MLRVSFVIRSTEIHPVFFGLLPASFCFSSHQFMLLAIYCITRTLYISKFYCITHPYTVHLKIRIQYCKPWLLVRTGVPSCTRIYVYVNNYCSLYLHKNLFIFILAYIHACIHVSIYVFCFFPKFFWHHFSCHFWLPSKYLEFAINCN